MKKVFLSVLFFASVLFSAEAPKFYHDYNTGLQTAQKENKMILLMIHTKGCPECAYMKEVVFTQDETSKFMSENFVNIALDFKDAKIPSKYPRIGVPTFYITDKDGNVITQQIGATRGNRFLKILEKAKAKHES